MKKFCSILLAAAIILCGSAAAFAADVPGLVIGNEPVQFTESTGFPFVDEANRTLVPLRVALEAFGCEVEWDAANQCAVVSQNDITVTVPLQQKYIIINGMKAEIDTQAVAKNGRIYLPLRAVLEAFGGEVSWESKTNCITVAKPDEAPQLEELSIASIHQLIVNSICWLYPYNHYSVLPTKTSGGFFISPDGLAVVSAAAIKDSTAACVEYVKYGIYLDVESVLYMSEELDIAIIRVSPVPSGPSHSDVEVQFDYLPLVDIEEFEPDEELRSLSVVGSHIADGDLLQNGIDVILAENCYKYEHISAGLPYVDIYGRVVAVSASNLPSDTDYFMTLPAKYIIEALKHLDEQPYGTVNNPVGKVEIIPEKSLYHVDVGETVYIPITVNTSGGAQQKFLYLTLGQAIQVTNVIWLENGECLLLVSGLDNSLGILMLYNANSDEVDVIMLCVGDTRLKINYYPDHPGVPDFGNSLFASNAKVTEYNGIKEYFLLDDALSALDLDAWYEYYCALLEYAGCEHIKAGEQYERNIPGVYRYDIFLSPDKTEEICVWRNAVITKLYISFKQVAD